MHRHQLEQARGAVHNFGEVHGEGLYGYSSQYAAVVGGNSKPMLAIWRTNIPL